MNYRSGSRGKFSYHTSSYSDLVLVFWVKIRRPLRFQPAGRPADPQADRRVGQPANRPPSQQQSHQDVLQHILQCTPMLRPLCRQLPHRQRAPPVLHLSRPMLLSFPLRKQNPQPLDLPAIPPLYPQSCQPLHQQKVQRIPLPHYPPSHPVQNPQSSPLTFHLAIPPLFPRLQHLPRFNHVSFPRLFL